MSRSTSRICLVCSTVAVFALVGCTVPSDPTAQPATTSASASASATGSAEVTSSSVVVPTATPTAPASKPGQSASAPATPGRTTAPPGANQPPPAQAPTVTRVPGTPKRDAYLTALTAAGVPVSPTGDEELLVGQAICKELAKGTPRATVVGYIGDFGGNLNPQNADTVVTAAENTYC